MKNFSVFCSFAAVLTSSLFCAEPTKPDQEQKVVMEAYPDANYLDAETVDVRYGVINNTSNAISIVGGNDVVKIRLLGPDGQPVRPYPYRIAVGSRVYGVDSVAPGAKYDSFFRLSAVFPFPVTGEYRCLFTQRVYLHDSPELPDSLEMYKHDYYGEPFDVTASEFKFRVEKPTRADWPKPAVDPSNHIYEAGLEYDTMPSKRRIVMGERQFLVKDQPMGGEVASTSTPVGRSAEAPESKMKIIMIVFAAVVVAGLGLTGFLKRKSR